MALSATDFGTFLTELRTQLVARAALSNVWVVTGSGSQNPTDQDLIEFLSADADSEQLTMSGAGGATADTGTRRVEVDVEGRIEVVRPNAPEDTTGANVAAAAARDRALTLLGEVEGECDDDTTVNGTCEWARITAWSWEDQAVDAGHRAVVEFTLSATFLVT